LRVSHSFHVHASIGTSTCILALHTMPLAPPTNCTFMHTWCFRLPFASNWAAHLPSAVPHHISAPCPHQGHSIHLLLLPCLPLGSTSSSLPHAVASCVCPCILCLPSVPWSCSAYLTPCPSGSVTLNHATLSVCPASVLLRLILMCWLPPAFLPVLPVLSLPWIVLASAALPSTFLPRFPAVWLAASSVLHAF